MHENPSDKNPSHSQSKNGGLQSVYCTLHYFNLPTHTVLANQMFWDICSKRPNVLGQDLTEEDNRAKICFDKSEETESEIIV